MNFQIGHTVSIAILDIFGLIVNSWFLYTIKTRYSPANAIDVLQACKAALCILSLLCCVWLEFLICTSKLCVGGKRISNDLLFYSTCLIFVTIAYIRLKACECRGRASLLVTKSYALKTFLVSATPAAMFVAATLALMSNPNISVMSKKYANISSTEHVDLLSGTSMLGYEVCHLLIFVVVPLISGTMMYLKIYKIVTQTAKTVDSVVTNRQRDPSKTITMSMLLLLSTMLAMWGLYIAVKLTSLFVNIDEVVFLYWKLLVLIIHPFGEGVLKKSAKLPVEKFKEILPDRSTRQVYPYDSPTLTDSDREDRLESLAVKLPTLIEEKERTTTREEENENNGQRMRRTSYTHPRKSVLIRNAEVIGLEYQEQNHSIDFHRQRKESEERLRKDLKNIEEAAVNRHRARRLSTCLRFTTDDDNSEDEILQMYKTLYYRRGSKYSEKSKGSSNANAIQEISESDTSIPDSVKRKISTSSSKASSPSHKLWRKLFTTAKTARKFSEIRKHKTSEVIVEEFADENAGASSNSKTQNQIHEEVRRATPKMSVYSMAQQEKYLQNGQLRGSLDSHLPTSQRPKRQTKKRSISCVNNVWLQAQNEKERDRKKSVSFISSVFVNGASTSHSEPPLPRSVSYDSKIQVNYQQGSAKKKAKTRRSHGDLPKRNSKSKSKSDPWFKELSREQCIDRLMKMKEFF